MSDWGSAFDAASAMQIYEETLVGALFEPLGRIVVDVAGIAPGHAVCDVACGPGSVTRLASLAAGPHGTVTGVDISAGMLEVAVAKGPVEGGAPIEYVEAPAERLPLADGSVDAVLCQQGMQFFPDRLAAATEMRRVLRPGGRAVVAVWASIEGTPAFAALAGAIERVFGSEPVAGYRAGPWGFPDLEPLAAIHRDAGFTSVRAEVQESPVHFAGGIDQLLATTTFSVLTPRLAEPGARDALRAAANETLAPLVAGGEIRSYATTNMIVAEP